MVRRRFWLGRGFVSYPVPDEGGGGYVHVTAVLVRPVLSCRLSLQLNEAIRRAVMVDVNRLR